MKKNISELSLRTAVIISVLIMLSAVVAGLLTKQFFM